MTYFARKYNAEIPAEPSNLVFESFARAIRGAPLENKRAVLRLIAVDACRRCYDDLSALARASGLVETFGTVTVQNDLASAFGWSRS
jgi:hypothetical protein